MSLHVNREDLWLCECLVTFRTFVRLLLSVNSHVCIQCLSVCEGFAAVLFRTFKLPDAFVVCCHVPKQVGSLLVGGVARVALERPGTGMGDDVSLQAMSGGVAFSAYTTHKRFDLVYLSSSFSMELFVTIQG